MASPAPSIVPAQLGFLAIYNPTLGATDDTIEDQIVYYASVGTPQPGRRRRARNRPISTVSQDERNERLRQIGLAQGMVEFGRSFSGDRPVDTVETDKSRVIMHELEPGWWILASVDLTKLPAPKGKQASSASKGKGADAKSDDAEYSSREVKPAALLLQDLMRAHSVFLLHHDSSLSSLFVRTKRVRFSLLLGRYWDMFLSTWNVMLHGNPIVNVFGGIKVAASGELGIGVGEEDRGSGEREVLEGLTGRIEGLVDLVVSKFGDYDPQGPAEAEPAATAAASNMDPTQPPDMWLGTGAEPAAEDGAIFLGTGALSRHSLRDLTHWMEDIYSFGENAYGVRESATSTRRTKSRRKSTAHKQTLEPILLPPPPVTELARRAKQASPTRKSSSKTQEQRAGASSPAAGSAGATVQDEPDSTGMAKYVDYLKMGYGKYWSIGSTAAAEPAEEQAAGTGAGNSALASPDTTASAAPRPKEPPFQDESSGHYLIGLMGNVEGTAGTSEEDSVATEDLGHNSRTLLRTVTVELDSPELERSESQTMKDLGSHDTELFQTTSGDDDPSRTASRPGTSRTASLAAPNGGGARRESFNSQDRNKTHKLRIVIYVNRPFMYAFLFRLRTDSLAWDGLYKSLHTQLAPLHRPLLSSTSYRPERPGVDAGGGGGGSGPAVIYDLVWDPNSLTVHSTIPSIPDPAAPWTTPEGPVAAWSRVEALNTHTQMLNTHIATRQDRSELERTCKTSRGWWIVWNRVTDRETAAMRAEAAASSAGSSLSEDGSDSEGRSEETTKPDRDSLRHVTKEIFLIRKASDHPDAGSGGAGVGGAFRNVSGSYGAGGSGRWADGASRLAQGIGVDTRKYIEGLISMNR